MWSPFNTGMLPQWTGGGEMYIVHLDLDMVGKPWLQG